MLLAAVDEASMSGDPDEYASLRKKLRAWSQRQVERERRRKWLFAIAAGVIWLLLLYWFIHGFARRFL
jgi:hypothetical protein